MKKLVSVALMASALSSCAVVDISKYKDNPDMPIVIGNYYQIPPNSAGGVKFHFLAYNNTDKAIKYFQFYMGHKNRVNDVVKSSIGGYETKGYQFVGPFANGSKIYGVFGPNFYNYSAYCAELKEVRVEYMDGTTLDLKGEELTKTFAFVGNTCRQHMNHQTPY